MQTNNSTYGVAWWRNGRASDFRPRGLGFDPRSGRSCVTTLGKLFTPTCLDAESLRYYMESLNWVPLPLLRRRLGPDWQRWLAGDAVADAASSEEAREGCSSKIRSQQCQDTDDAVTGRVVGPSLSLGQRDTL